MWNWPCQFSLLSAYVLYSTPSSGHFIVSYCVTFYILYPVTFIPVIFLFFSSRLFDLISLLPSDNFLYLCSLSFSVSLYFPLTFASPLVSIVLRIWIRDQDNKFPPPLLFFCCCWIWDPGWIKIRIRNKDPGSATLVSIISVPHIMHVYVSFFLSRSYAIYLFVRLSSSFLFSTFLTLIPGSKYIFFICVHYILQTVPRYHSSSVFSPHSQDNWSRICSLYSFSISSCLTLWYSTGTPGTRPILSASHPRRINPFSGGLEKESAMG